MAAFSAVINPADQSAAARAALVFAGLTPGANTLALDFSAWTGATGGIGNARVTVSPAGNVADLYVDSTTWLNGIVTVSMTSGRAGIAYAIIINASDLAGRALSRTAEFRF